LTQLHINVQINVLLLHWLFLLQATLEFIRCPGINGKIYGKTKYDLYGHGGLLFMSSTSLFLALVSVRKNLELCITPEFSLEVFFLIYIF